MCSFNNLADRLDAEDARESDVRRVSLPGKELRAVQPEGPNPNEKPTGFGRRNRAAL